MNAIILEAKSMSGNGGMACGPVSGPNFSEIHVQYEDGTDAYFCLAEIMSTPIFYKTDRSTIQDQMDEVEEVYDYLNSGYQIMDEITDYEELFDELRGEDDVEDANILRLLVCLICDENFCDDLIGKTMKEIGTPISELEQSYMDVHAMYFNVASESGEREVEVIIPTNLQDQLYDYLDECEYEPEDDLCFIKELKDVYDYVDKEVIKALAMNLHDEPGVYKEMIDAAEAWDDLETFVDDNVRYFINWPTFEE